ncbi:MAG: response regulator transcription factor [Ruminiclostridium sp.]|nr:response regulator transcription factor [Ruminiclostridium sp.]
MTVAICDDDLLCREQILAWAREYIQQSPDPDSGVCGFSASEELLEAVEGGRHFDVCILDIVMPGMDGIRLGVRLRQLGYEGRILYLTSSRDYAIDSFRAKPFNYILKPVEKAAFLSALEEARASLPPRGEKSILVRTQEASVKVDLSTILYAERSNRTVRYYLMGGTLVESIQIRSSFTEAIQPLLADERFVLCGASMAANLHHVIAIEAEALLFRDSQRAYLGKKLCREIRSVWFDYHFDGEGSL